MLPTLALAFPQPPLLRAPHALQACAVAIGKGVAVSDALAWALAVSGARMGGRQGWACWLGAHAGVAGEEADTCVW